TLQGVAESYRELSDSLQLPVTLCNSLQLLVLLRRSVLGDAVAEGPVLLLHLDQADQDVLLPDAQLGVQAVGRHPIEGLPDLDGPPFIEGDLDEDHAVR